ncbi:MAG: PQQ-binding-like beta-propeller repeat protein, partial [Planctomycetota bacterium]
MHEADYARLSAWAGALRGDEAERDRALAVLTEHETPSELQALSRQLDRIDRVAKHPNADGPSGLAQGPPLDRPLWRTAIPAEPSAPEIGVMSPRTYVAEPEARPRLVPVAADGLVLVNDNLRVMARDAISGWERWSYMPDRPEPEQPRSRFNANRRVVLDERRVLVHGDAAYAVMGQVSPWQGRRRLRIESQPTRLVCLDLETGEPRWTRSGGELDESLVRAAFHGTPVAAGDLVIALARRSQATSFQDSYLVAVDAADGSLRWRRHLASTAGPNNRNVLSPFSTMSLDGERVYVSDNLGAVASVEARTGAVRWVQVLTESDADAPAAGGVGQNLLPFSVRSAPVRCRAGLVVPVRLGASVGFLLDAEDGRVVRRFTTNDELDGATELLPLPDGDLIAVGPNLTESAADGSSGPGVIRLDGDTLASVWRHVETTTPNAAGAGGSPHTTVLPEAGRVLTVSASRRLHELDLADGTARRESAMPWVGTVTRAGGAWVLGGERRLAGYLEWSVAYAILRERAGAADATSDVGLNLAQLAVEAGEADAVAEGAGLALAALARRLPGGDTSDGVRAAERSRVFEALLSITRRQDTVDAAVLESLFDRLAVATESPEELLAYHVARGEFLEAGGRPDEAAAFYQSVLLDPAQSKAQLRDGEGSRRGELVARQRLVSMRGVHGGGFYTEFDRQARRELTALRQDPKATAEALLAVSARYPLAEAGPEAVFAAAERLAGGASPAAAVTQYRRAFQLSRDAELRGRAAGALAELYVSRGRPDAAARWLDQVSRDAPELRPLRDGVPTRPSDWIPLLPGADRSAGRRPRVNPPFGEP